MNMALSQLSELQSTVLIVDDTPANLGVLVEQLEEHHFQVVVAQDGEEGLQRARYVQPDIILLDVMMPGIDGFEVCRQLKAEERTREIPVIFMTALTDTRNKVTGFDVGGADYVTKPFQIEEVVSRINTHLDLCSIQRQLAEQNSQLQEEIQVRKQTEADLHRTLREQKRLLEHAGVGIAFLQGRQIIRCNQKMASLFGYDMDALGNIPLEHLYAMEHTGEYLDNAAGQVLARDGEYTSDIRYQRRDGSRFWGGTILKAIDEEDISQGEILVVHDIEQRKRSEALRTGQGQLFEMMATGAPLGDVLNRLIHLVESQQDDTVPAFFLTEGEETLKLTAAPGLPQAFCCEYKDRFPEGEPISTAIGPNGVAVSRRQPVWVADMAQTPEWEEYCSLAARHGLRSCWSIPVLPSQGEVLGILAFFFREPYQRDQLDKHLVDMAARIAAIAIERHQAEEQIQFMAHHDALTGLPNRVLLEDRLNQGILLAQRYSQHVSVVFFDLDHFKIINDSLGHKYGDELLQVIAQRLKQCVRCSDTVVRLGGDEFVILLYDQPSPQHNAVPVLKKILDAIAQPIQIDGRELQVTCSMGLANYPGDGEDTHTLLRNADIAMYRAKELGRHNFQYYSQDMDSNAQDRLMFQEGLRHALEKNELLLHYQAQYDLRSERLIGMEVLLRWQHPELGMLMPDRFIQLAETTGLIVPIGDWVLQTACKQNRAWQESGLPRICVSVNLSARQFHEEDLPERVTRALEVSGLEARYLDLELTESMVMQNPQQAVETMNKLVDMGVKLSIDDFGTGYSNLSALKKFPVTRLKIDKSFVTDLPGDREDCSIAQAMISLGHSLKLKVIAEGVEDREQMDFLRAQQCDEIQGYYFSRPIPKGEFEQFLSTFIDAGCKKVGT